MNKKAIVGIVGIGYVGSALAEQTGPQGFKTLGFDINPKQIHIMNSKNIPNFLATDNFSKLTECDIIVVCVPTPIHADLTPDLRNIQAAIETVTTYLKPYTLVIIESTIAVGTTRKIIYPQLKKTNGKTTEFYLAFSPERVDPGNKTYTIANTPKIVGGYTTADTTLAVAFYQQCIEKVIPVSSLEVAEMSKLFENVFRFVNIGLVNELQEYAKAVGIDMWEVIDAAATKPYGFLPHYPSPGIGGHCIAVDPYYLLEDAKKHKVELSMVSAAGKINEEQPKKIVKKALSLLNTLPKKVEKKKVLLVGIAYKPDIADIRESAALKIWELLEKENLEVSFYDPYATEANSRQSIDLTHYTLSEFDLIIIITPHSTIDYQLIVSSNRPILDTRKTLHQYSSHEHIFSV